MSEILTSQQAALLQRLFAPVERWGWEYREPEALPAVFPHPRPALHLPWPDWATQAAPKLEAAERRKAGYGVGAALTLCIAIATQGSPATGLFFLVLTGVLGWLGFGAPWLLQRKTAARQRAWMEASVQAHDRYTEEHQRWAMAKQHHQDQELHRLATTPEWAAIRPKRTTARLDVYGGTSYGWEAFITNAGASVIGAGVQLTIGDLTQQAVAAELGELAALAGHHPEVTALPEQLEQLDLFAGLSADEVRDVLVESLHGDDRDATHETRSLDARVIGGLCETLGGPYTIGRVCAGLRVLLRQDPPPGPGEDNDITLEEYKRVSDLFGERFRAAAESRIAALEARLHNLRRLGGRPYHHPFGGDARLRVVGITPDGSDLVGDVLAHLLIQVLIHAARRPAPGGSGQSVLFVAGADALPRRHLERLDQLATQRGIRLAYMFRHVRDEATDLLGGGGAAFFMRVGNAKEAGAVAEFIGREHKFVLHQLTRSTGESTTHTVGDSTSETLGDQSSETFSKQFQAAGRDADEQQLHHRSEPVPHLGGEPERRHRHEHQ